MKTAIYFDNNGTTALDKRVLEAMLPYLAEQPGNATSRHVYGRSARTAIDQARQQVAAAVGAHPSQIVFTGSGTEADNLAITGMATTRDDVEQIAYSAIEHPAVMRPAQAMCLRGKRAAVIGVDGNGQVRMTHLQELLQTPTALVSVMLANNETGVVQDIAGIAEEAKRHGAYMHTDAVQALGKLPLDFAALGVHAMSLSSHKINGPQGLSLIHISSPRD